MIIHKEGEDQVSLATITQYLRDNGIVDGLTYPSAASSYKTVGWGDGTNDQMHNKFLLVNKTRSGTTDYHSIVYTTNVVMIHEVGTSNKEVYQDFHDVFDYIFDY